MVIYIYECSTCRYVGLKDLNILHLPRPRFIAPVFLRQVYFFFISFATHCSSLEQSEKDVKLFCFFIVCLSFGLLVCLLVCYFVCLSFGLFVCLLFVTFFVCLLVCLSVCLSVTLFVCLVVCLSVCLFVTFFFF